MRDYLIDALIAGPRGVKTTRRFYIRAERPMDAKAQVLLQAEGDDLQPCGIAHMFVRDADGEYRQMF